MMTAFEMFNKIYNLVKANSIDVTPKNRMGGIFSPDEVRESGGIRVMMTDGGYGQCIIEPGALNCFIGYPSQEVRYMVGTEADLKSLYDELFKNEQVDPEFTKFVEFIKDGASL
jgi:hypothetical protein